jgi:Fe-S cluster biogenesis protein NfuA
MSPRLIDPQEMERLSAREGALNELRPFLEADGGDITLEDISDEGVARVRLHGACSNCAMSP